MSDFSQGPGWWQASDGKWYPPEQAPGGTGAGATAPATAGVDIGGAISYGWNKFTQNVGPLIVAYLLILVVAAIINGIGFAIDSFVLRLIINLIAIFIVAAISFGLVRISLKIVNGQPVEISDAMPSGPQVVPYALTAILVQIIVTIGLYLCVIPGLIAALFLWFAQFAVIDENLQPGDAIKRSIDLVKPHWGGVLGFMVVAVLINVVGAILCLVGLLVTAPLTTVAAAHVFKSLKGEPVAP
jgi:hypothetical protein